MQIKKGAQKSPLLAILLATIQNPPYFMRYSLISQFHCVKFANLSPVRQLSDNIEKSA